MINQTTISGATVTDALQNLLAYLITIGYTTKASDFTAEAAATCYFEAYYPDTTEFYVKCYYSSGTTFRADLYTSAGIAKSTSTTINASSFNVFNIQTENNEYLSFGTLGSSSFCWLINKTVSTDGNNTVKRIAVLLNCTYSPSYSATSTGTAPYKICNPFYDVSAAANKIAVANNVFVSSDGYITAVLADCISTTKTATFQTVKINGNNYYMLPLSGSSANYQYGYLGVKI